MFQTILECGVPMEEYLDEHFSKAESVDIQKIAAYFSTDVIGSCAFGISCNSFKDPNSQFATIGRRAFRPPKAQILQALICLNFPDFSKILGLRLTDKVLSDFYMGVVQDTIDYREKNNILRNDFMQILMELKSNENGELEKLTVEEIAAQAFLFFLAGFDTSSSALTLCFIELAYNTEIQSKLIQEIQEVLIKHNGTLTYEAVMEMKYMNQVVKGTCLKICATINSIYLRFW